MSTMLRKTVQAHVTKARTDGSGEFTGLVSTFGPPPDLQGDVIAWAAFDESIAKWKRRGEWPPLLWQHDASTPENVVGRATDMHPTPEGLVVSGKLNLDKPRGLSVYESMLDGSIGQFSIGYFYGPDDRAWMQDEGYYVLKRVDLAEISIVVAGANENTRVLSVKCTGGTCGCGGGGACAAPPARKAESLAAFKQKMLAKFGDDDVFREILGEPTRSSIEAAKRKARAAEARREADMRSLALLGVPPSRVLVDSRMRPIIDDEIERERERRERESAERERLDMERNKERGRRGSAPELLSGFYLVERSQRRG